MSASTLIMLIASRGHASRDAPRHKWHRLWIQLAERMAQVTFSFRPSATYFERPK